MHIRRSQEQRRADTQRALLGAARQMFGAKGYAATGTPEIVAAAGVTRGALYHHYADKLALFQAVVEQELDAMREPGRRQILLVDAPAVLGRTRLDSIDGRYGLRTLIAGVTAAVDAKAIKALPVLPLAHLLNALFDRAAMAEADELADYRKTIKALLRGLKT